MRQLDFYKLGRPVQERFLGAARGAAAPAPILAMPAGRVLPGGWIAAAVVFIGGLFVAIGLGFGDLRHTYALAPGWMIGVYSFLVAAASVCALQAAGKVQARTGLPYRAGTYLFPVGVVDATTPTLRVFPLSTLKEVTADKAGAKLRLSFSPGGTFEFPLPTREHADRARDAVLQAQQKLQQAEAARNDHDLALLDPLKDSGVPNPLLPTTPLTRNVPGWRRFAIPLSLALGVALGAGMWYVRNAVSEKRIFAAAHSENTVAGYQAYLQRGGHRSDVSDLLLPRAELQVAHDQGTVAAVQQFIDEHPGTLIGAEVQVALRDALLRELGEAQKAGTVTALRALGKQNEQYLGLIEAEYRKAVDNVYARALSDFEKKAAPDNPDVKPFFKRLLAFSQKYGPRVEVRFRRQPTKGAEEMDKTVRSNPYYLGVQSLPSQYFEDNALRAREEKTGQALVDRMQAAFPKDILEFAVGQPLPSSEDDLPKVTVPTLFVDYRAALSGNFLSVKPKSVFAGAGLTFQLTFKIPKRKAALEQKVSMWRRPDIKAVHEENLKPPEVYARMIDGAFERCSKRWLKYVFAEP